MELKLNKISNLFLLKSIFLFIIFIFSSNYAKNEDKTIEKKIKIFKFTINDEINLKTYEIVKKAFAKADEIRADYIFLELNTYGGSVVDADSIRTKILNSLIPVIVFINNNAASAGALISLACDSIYMKPEGTIGATTVVDQKGEVVPDKYQSYMRAMMRATAAMNGRNPKIAEAMVDPDIELDSISAKGKVLTFTSYEALKNDFCDGIVKTQEEIFNILGLNNYELITLEFSTAEKIKLFFVNPAISSLLIMAIVGGIYFELQTPGLGFPSIIAVSAAVLYFVPYYIEGLASNWEILIFILGVLFLCIEIFVLPGFGVFGILGIAFVIYGLSFGMLSNEFVFNDGVNFNFSNVLMPVAVVSISILGGIIISIFITKMFFNETKISSTFALYKTLYNEKGISSTGEKLKDMLGKTGVTLTDLKLSGRITIEGKVYDAVSQGGFIAEKTNVEVVGYDLNNLLVKIKE